MPWLVKTGMVHAIDSGRGITLYRVQRNSRQKAEGANEKN